MSSSPFVIFPVMYVIGILAYVLIGNSSCATTPQTHRDNSTSSHVPSVPSTSSISSTSSNSNEQTFLNPLHQIVDDELRRALENFFHVR